MKIKNLVLLSIVASGVFSGVSGCSLFRHGPKSSWKIIDEGDPNPFITDAPTRAGTETRKVDVDMGQQMPPR